MVQNETPHHMLEMAIIHKQPPLVFEHLIVMYIPSTLKCEAQMKTQKDISQENNQNKGQLDMVQEQRAVLKREAGVVEV